LDRLDQFLRTASIEIVPFTADHAAVARQTFLRYGKGRHPAALNFGDCIAYATARLEAMPLLFKGDDFRLTDIEAAV
jgi:ribonuclease VapC